MELGALMQAVRTHQASDAWRPAWTQEHWAVLERQLVRRSFAAGELLLSGRGTDDQVLWVESGTVQTSVTLVGGARRVALRRAGSIIGEATLFSDQPAPLRAEGLGPGVVWSLDRRRVVDLLAHQPVLAAELLRSAGAVMVTRERDWLVVD
ncbi:MAG: Crp/Fnr family transcriptional regulator [Aquabacterium sp.]